MGRRPPDAGSPLFVLSGDWIETFPGGRARCPWKLPATEEQPWESGWNRLDDVTLRMVEKSRGTLALEKVATG